MTAHPLAGHFSVDASARRVRHYRYAEERLMRIMAGAIALTPELPVKLLLGRHVWDCAQHADLWGRRLPELRAPAQQSEPASDGVARVFDLVESRQARRESIERVVGLYRVVKPHLVAVYERHLAVANPIYEPPTRRILERCVEEERRHVAAGAIVLGRLLAGEADRRRATEWEGTLRAALVAAGGVAGDGDVTFVDAVRHSGGERDVVALDSAFDPGVLSPELAPAVEAIRRAVRGGEWAAAEPFIAPAVRLLLVAECATLRPVRDVAIAAQAKIGPGCRLVKLRVHGARELAMLQLEWRRAGDGWQVTRADRIATEPLG
jgi:hypothetical protein